MDLTLHKLKNNMKFDKSHLNIENYFYLSSVFI